MISEGKMLIRRLFGRSASFADKAKVENSIFIATIAEKSARVVLGCRCASKFQIAIFLKDAVMGELSVVAQKLWMISF